MSYKNDVIIYEPEDDTWAPTGYDGYYVSEQGNVWGAGRYGRGKILKPFPDHHGHLYITIATPEGHIRKSVHRLVAETFIPNPHNYPMVRHLDDDPTNNNVDNLAWGTSFDNVHDAIRNRTAYCLECRTPVKALDLLTGDIYEFESQVKAARTLGADTSAITRVLNNKGGQANGYVFCYKDESFDDYDYDNHRKTYVKILATNLETGEHTIFNSQKEASYVLGIGSRMINRVLRGGRPYTHGYTFEYVSERRCQYE